MAVVSESSSAASSSMELVAESAAALTVSVAAVCAGVAAGAFATVATCALPLLSDGCATAVVPSMRAMQTMAR